MRKHCTILSAAVSFALVIACSTEPVKIDVTSLDLSQYQYVSTIVHGKIKAIDEKIPLSKFITDLNEKKVKYRLYCYSHNSVTLLVERELQTVYYSFYKDKNICEQNSKINNEFVNLNYEYPSACERIKFLLENGADVNSTGSYSVLYNSIFSNNIESVKALVEKGADLNIRDIEGNTPLSKASWKGYISIVQYLVEKGALINYCNNPPLCWASYPGKNDVVKYLIQKGADVNIKDKEGKTPLHYAAESDQIKIMKILLDSGADISAKDSHQNSPLLAAIRNNKINACNFLILNHADVNQADDCGKTPLHYAILFSNKETLKLLIDNGADVNCVNRINELPLHYAAGEGNIDEIKILMDNGSKKNVQTSDHGLSPLHEAVISGNIENIKFLVSKECDITLKTTDSFYIGENSSRPYIPKGSTAADIAKIIYDKTQDTFYKGIVEYLKGN